MKTERIFLNGCSVEEEFLSSNAIPTKTSVRIHTGASEEAEEERFEMVLL